MRVLWLLLHFRVAIFHELEWILDGFRLILVHDVHSINWLHFLLFLRNEHVFGYSGTSVSLAYRLLLKILKAPAFDLWLFLGYNVYLVMHHIVTFLLLIFEKGSSKVIGLPLDLLYLILLPYFGHTIFQLVDAFLKLIELALPLGFRKVLLGKRLIVGVRIEGRFDYREFILICFNLGFCFLSRVTILYSFQRIKIKFLGAPVLIELPQVLFVDVDEEVRLAKLCHLYKLAENAEFSLIKGVLPSLFLLNFLFEIDLVEAHF